MFTDAIPAQNFILCHCQSSRFREYTFRRKRGRETNKQKESSVSEIFVEKNNNNNFSESPRSKAQGNFSVSHTGSP